MPFKISKNYHNTDWTRLNLIDDTNVNWEEGISIIKERFKSRFFDQIDCIKNDEFSGFAIMSLDCLLIETLMQFYLGVDNSEINYRGNQWRAFRDFLINSRHFNGHFNTDPICRTFYDHFRCGLLHQAQTKQKSLIKICQHAHLVLVDPSKPAVGLIIDREQFHTNLISEFNDYIGRMQNNEATFNGQNARLMAIEKMKLICAE